MSEFKIDKNFDRWLEQLYDPNAISEIELTEIANLTQYQGFNRSVILKKMFEKLPDKKLVIRAIIAVAVQGPQRASKLKIFNGRSLTDMGIPASGSKGTDTLSCNRISASTADVAAFYLKKMKVSKRMNVACPAWLQFATAGSIKLPEDLRAQHREFAKKFSESLPKGVFNENIYDQMALNSYCDPKLNLFD